MEDAPCVSLAVHPPTCPPCQRAAHVPGSTRRSPRPPPFGALATHPPHQPIAFREGDTTQGPTNPPPPRVSPTPSTAAPSTPPSAAPSTPQLGPQEAEELETQAAARTAGSPEAHPAARLAAGSQVAGRIKLLEGASRSACNYGSQA